ncbi:MAG: hypothetical protein ABSD48_06525 [Armatimonadota bacterium]
MRTASRGLNNDISVRSGRVNDLGDAFFIESEDLGSDVHADCLSSTLNIIAIKVQAVHGGVGPQTGFLPPNVMFASNFERKHL